MKHLLQKITAFSISAVSLFSFTAMTVSSYETNTMQYGELSEETVNFYTYWKEKYLAQNPYVTDETQYYVYYADEVYQGWTIPVTVSEAHGYGMLIAASMAEYDSEAKEIFDGMYCYYKAHPSSIGSNLMAWQQADNGSALVDYGGNDSATDGDMDIAYSLLMADSIWGSDGTYNYKQTAIDMINDIMEYDVNQDYWILRLGDWATSGNYRFATRPSDFMVQYMPVFAEVTGDKRWMNVYDTTYSIINSITQQYGTGILPDFVMVNSDGSFSPASPNFLESENDGNYYYNSCRTPWRISMDYLINGNKDALAFANAITDFIIEETDGDPWEIMAGYTPQGVAISNWNDLCFNSPFMLAAACNETYSEWHDAVREMCLNYGEDVYFGDTITMLCLIVDDGGWLVPQSTSPSVRGDINADGVFSVADVVVLQKWLLCTPDVEISDWKAGNLCEDQHLDVFDLCLMKHKLVENIKDA